MGAGHIYYHNDGDVQGDEELSGWLDDLHPSSGSRVLHMISPRTVAELKMLLTNILWVSTAYHNVLNAAQWDMAGFIPNQPGASNIDPLQSPSAPAASVVLATGVYADSTKQRALGMVRLLASLALFQPDQLGDYRWCGPFADQRVNPIVSEFRLALAQIEAQMQHVDDARTLKFQRLRPSKMSNSSSA
jgi:Lipoxygenase